jgi:hypothetical protein
MYSLDTFMFRHTISKDSSRRLYQTGMALYIGDSRPAAEQAPASQNSLVALQSLSPAVNDEVYKLPQSQLGILKQPILELLTTLAST